MSSTSMSSSSLSSCSSEDEMDSIVLDLLMGPSVRRRLELLKELVRRQSVTQMSARMASDKAESATRPSKTHKKRLPVGPGRAQCKKIKPNKKMKSIDRNSDSTLPVLSTVEQLNFFVDQFQSANGIKLSSLELDSIKDTCILQPSKELDQVASNLGKHMMAAFGSSWKEVLYEGHLVEGKIDPGSPAVLVISSSAIGSFLLQRGLRSLTGECHAVDLFTMHLQVEDLVSMLKKRVNIACGSPSRIKQFCEMEALQLSRLAVIVLDMHTDLKGYSLFTHPQVRDEFWDLYKRYFHNRLIQGDLRVCLYGPIPIGSQPSKNNALD